MGILGFFLVFRIQCLSLSLKEPEAKLLFDPLNQDERREASEFKLGEHVEDDLQLNGEQGQAQAQQLVQKAIVLHMGRQMEARGPSSLARPP